MEFIIFCGVRVGRLCLKLNIIIIGGVLTWQMPS